MKLRALSVGLLLGLPACAWGQAVYPFSSTPDITPQRDRLQDTPPAPQDAVTAPMATPVPREDDALIVPELRRVEVLEVDAPGGRPHAPGLSRVDFRSSLAPFIGHPLTFSALNLIVRRINVACRLSDMPFGFAYAPPQTIRQGVLRIVLQRYQVGTIDVTGNRWFSKKLIAHESGLTPGAAPSLSSLQSDIDWLNRNPFRSAEIVFSPGQKNGETNADIYVSDRFPVYFFAGSSNQNDPSLGRNGWFAGASWGNAFGLDQILTYQYSQTTTGRFFNHAAAWQIPLNSRNSILVYGNYAHAHPTSTDIYQNYGGGASVSLRWMHMLDHLPIGRSVGIDGTIQAGYDWKNANSYQMLGSTAAVIGNADLNQLVLFYNGSIQDPWGKTDVTNLMAYGISGLTRRDDARAYQTIFRGARPNYYYDRVSIHRGIETWRGLTLNLRATRQEATKNLLYSEQLMIGGIGTVRGYYLNTSFGSIATLLSADLTTPPLTIDPVFGKRGIHNETTLSVFWDYGNNTQVRQVVSGIHSVTLQSVGVSATSKFTHWITAVVDVGWRLRRARSVGAKGAMVDFNIVAGF